MTSKSNWFKRFIKWLNPSLYTDYNGKTKEGKPDIEVGFKFKPNILWNKEKHDSEMDS